MPVYLVFETPLSARIVEHVGGMFAFGGNLYIPKFKNRETAEAHCKACGIKIIA